MLSLFKSAPEPPLDAKELAERALLARVASGEMDAFERFYREYHRRVVSFAFRTTRRLDLAEEVASDTLMTVWRKADSFAGRSKVSTWVFGIAYRKALKALSKAARTPIPVDPHEMAEPEPEESADLAAVDTDRHLAAAVAKLPPEQRAVVALTYAYGYKYEEIARIVGCPVGTVKTRMRAARLKLRADYMELSAAEGAPDDV